MRAHHALFWCVLVHEVHESARAIRLPLPANVSNFSAAGLEGLTDVFTFGGNEQGQLGLIDLTDRHLPSVVPSLRNVNSSHLWAGTYYSLLRNEQDRCWAWGNDRQGQLGLTNDNVAPESEQISIPSAIPDWHRSPTCGPTGDHRCPVRFKALASIRQTTLAIDRAGRVVAWGRNDVGQLGLGDTGPAFLNRPSYPDFTERHVPWAANLPNTSAFVEIAAGSFHTMALTELCEGGVPAGCGRVWAWGISVEGQLGLGSAESRMRKPVAVPPIKGRACYFFVISRSMPTANAEGL